MGREAFCPSCGADVELDDAQLIDKRATCGACGRDFELVPELFGRLSAPAGLVRSGSRAELATFDPPPSPRVGMRKDGVLSLQRSRELLNIPVIWALVSAASCVCLVLGLAMSWLILPAAAVLVACVWPWRVRVAVKENRLVIGRGPFGLVRTTVPLASIDGVNFSSEPTVPLLSSRFVATTRLLVARVSDYPIELGSVPVAQTEDVKWVGRQLGRAIRLARLQTDERGES